MIPFIFSIKDYSLMADMYLYLPIKTDMSVVVNGDAVKMVALLNNALRVEINREASFYLSALHGIIDGGKNVLPGNIVCSFVRTFSKSYIPK
jgi:hypothetical protein